MQAPASHLEVAAHGPDRPAGTARASSGDLGCWAHTIFLKGAYSQNNINCIERKELI